MLGFVEFLLFCLSAMGLTFIIVDSTIMEPVRVWLKARLSARIFKVFECHQCCGTWAGFICGLVLLSRNPLVVLLCGFAGSVLSMFAAQVLKVLEQVSDWLKVSAYSKLQQTKEDDEGE